MEEIILLADGLINGGRESRIQAASELGKLSCRESKNKLVEMGFIFPLVSMICSGDHEEIQAALCSLLSLAFGSERTKIRIVKSGVLPVLLELLQSRNEAILELIAATLLVLSSCRQNKLAIVSSGAIQPLVEIFLNTEQNFVCNDTNNNDGISIQSKIDAIGTLHNLSTCHRIIPLIFSSGVTNSLLHIIQTSRKSIELAEKAIALLENLVYSSEELIQEMAVISNMVRVMVEVIEECSSQCKEHAVAILVNICRSCRDRYKLAILREGVMPGLLQLSVDGTWRAQSLAQELLLLLRDESGYGSRSKRSKNEEMIEQIMSEIESEEERVNEKTLRQIEEMIANLST